MDAVTMEVVRILKEFGPFTTPVCVILVVVIWQVHVYFTRLVSNLEEALASAREDATQLREKRARDLETTAREYAAQGEAIREVLRDWNTKASALLDVVRRGA